MRIDADLNGFDPEFADAPGFLLANQHGVRLQFHAEHQLAGVLEKLEEILAQEDLAPAEGEDEDASLRHLVEQMLDFRRSHLAVIVVVEIAVNAALVTPVSQVNLHGQRDTQGHRLLGHLLHKVAHRATPEAAFRGGIGSSETCRISWLASSRARASASCKATAGSTSNS